ncbi:phosphonate C-P lyase system protein PhnG [soil metagenome]
MNTQAEQAERARWISLLAKAPPKTFSAVVANFGALPNYIWLRRPEVGLAMVRARIGGTGDQFNLGEMSVTRCALRLESGEMGVAYVAGRDTRHAEYAAMFDALMQSEAREQVWCLVLQPIEAALAEKLEKIHTQAQATKVEFVTMARGDDA